MSATAVLGDFVVRAAQEGFSDRVTEKAAFCMLDTIGLGILSRDESTFLAVKSLLGGVSVGSRAAARVWADGQMASVSDAVLANAVAVHGQLHDDTDYSSWTHPASLVVPVAVSLGEAEGATVEDVLKAIAVGYNAIAWLGGGDAVARGMIDRGVRGSPTLGTVAAAATAAVLLHLDATKSINAVGIASSITGGVLEPVRCGSDEWRIQNGRAASGGLLAAQLAKKGVTGAAQGLEGPKGLLHALAGLNKPPALWTCAPDPEAILGVVAKPWATLGDNMAAVMAAKLIHDEKRGVVDIRHIKTHIWRHFTEYPGTSYRGPFERVGQALASMAFATAAMLVYGELEYDKALDHRNDPLILGLLPLITITPDDRGNPYDAVVEVSYADASVVSREAKEAGVVTLFHDRATSIELLEARLMRSGYRAGVGRRLANLVLAEVDQPSGWTIRELLDQLDRG